MKELLIVSIGSFFGGGARYAVSRLMQAWMATSFPLATFAVNVAGCFVIGLISGINMPGSWLSPSARLLLTTGFCGGFTTFSTFMNESNAMMKSGDYLLLFAYLGLSLLLGFAAVVAGNLTAKALA